MYDEDDILEIAEQEYERVENLDCSHELLRRSILISNIYRYTWESKLEYDEPKIQAMTLEELIYENKRVQMIWEMLR